MSNKEIWGLISIGTSLIGYGAYFGSILRGHTRPHAFSWAVWGLIDAVVFFAQHEKQAGPGAWAAGVTSFICFALAALAVFRGEKDIRQSDKIAFGGALAAIPLWYITKNPLWSVVLVTIINLLGFYPTFRKSWSKPREELAFMYSLDAGKYLFSIFAIEHYSLTTALYPVSVVLANSLFISMLFWRRTVLPISTK